MQESKFVLKISENILKDLSIFSFALYTSDQSTESNFYCRRAIFSGVNLRRNLYLFVEITLLRPASRLVNTRKWSEISVTTIPALGGG